MIKTRQIKVKSIENEETMMAMTMTKTITTKTIIIIYITIHFDCLKYKIVSIP